MDLLVKKLDSIWQSTLVIGLVFLRLIGSILVHLMLDLNFLVSILCDFGCDFNVFKVHRMLNTSYEVGAFTFEEYYRIVICLL